MPSLTTFCLLKLACVSSLWRIRYKQTTAPPSIGQQREVKHFPPKSGRPLLPPLPPPPLRCLFSLKCHKPFDCKSWWPWSHGREEERGRRGRGWRWGWKGRRRRSVNQSSHSCPCQPRSRSHSRCLDFLMLNRKGRETHSSVHAGVWREHGVSLEFWFEFCSVTGIAVLAVKQLFKQDHCLELSSGRPLDTQVEIKTNNTAGLSVSDGLRSAAAPGSLLLWICWWKKKSILLQMLMSFESLWGPEPSGCSSKIMFSHSEFLSVLPARIIQAPTSRLSWQKQKLNLVLILCVTVKQFYFPHL